jgi:hypothetical protein
MSISEQQRNDSGPPSEKRTYSPPARPASMDKDELGFERRKPVRWFSPSTLARTAAKVVLSLVFGDYLDKREMQQSLGPQVLQAKATGTDVWVDFVADTADGFDTSYSVAWSVAQREIAVEGVAELLPRADLLVLGGDQVYPYATVREYEDRFRGPYKAALPWTDPDSERDLPMMLALPGNHDWYDGLTGFMRMFAQGDRPGDDGEPEGGWLGGWQLKQSRSYFAVDLPGPFWLWGIDIQNDAYLDVAQIRYFEAAAKLMTPGERLILCTAVPSWAATAEDPRAYDNLAWVEKALVPDHVTTILMISGDKHHFARYDAEDSDRGKRVRLTAGGGGAFLSATHKLEQDLEVIVPQPRSSTASFVNAAKETFTRQRVYPEQRVSRRLSWRVLQLGRFNPEFMILPALVHLLLFITNTAALPSDTLPPWGDLFVRTSSPASIVLVFLLWCLLAAFFDAPKNLGGRTRILYKFGVGAVHTALHVLVQGLIAWIVFEVCRNLGGGALYMLAAGLIVLVLGGILGSLTFGVYLLFTFRVLGCHATEAFSAFRYEGYKNFLRMHITDEEITVYPIGIDRVCRQWDINDNVTDAEASYISPLTPIALHLIGDPITLR